MLFDHTREVPVQVLVQLAAADGDSQSLGRWCVETLGPELLASNPSVERLIVNVDADLPRDLRPYGSHDEMGQAVVSAALQLWVPELATFPLLLKPFDVELHKRVSTRNVYALTETEVMRKLDFVRGRPSPGIKVMSGLFFFDDLSDAAAKRLWAHHSELARRVHVGAVRYSRHWVDSVVTPGSPAIGGFADLHYPDKSALRDLYFDSPRGRDEIIHDIGHFVEGDMQRFFATEYVLL